MKANCAAFCFLILCAPAAQATVCHSKSIYHSVLSDPKSIYVQMFFDGVFASADGGATWQAAKHVPTRYVTEGFVAAAGKMFTLSSDGVMFASDDNGKTWRDHASAGKVSKLSASGAVVHACAEDKRTILSWHQGTARWKTVAKIKGDFYSGYERAPECEYVHVRGATITATGNGDVHRSLDGGKRWRTAIAPGYPHPSPLSEDKRLHIDADGTLYSTRITRNGSERMREAYYSRDGGLNWRPLPNAIEGELAGRPHQVEAVSGRDIYLLPQEGFQHTVTALYRSRNGRPAVKLIDLAASASLGDFRSVQLSGKTLLLTRTAGLHISLDDGQSWRTVRLDDISPLRTEVCS